VKLPRFSQISQGHRFTVVRRYSNSDKQNSQQPMGEKKDRAIVIPLLVVVAATTLCRTPRRGSPDVFVFLTYKYKDYS